MVSDFLSRHQASIPLVASVVAVGIYSLVNYPSWDFGNWLMVSVLVLQVVVPLWVYYDASKQGFDNPVEWMGVSAIPALNLLGVIAYLHKRRSRQTD